MHLSHIHIRTCIYDTNIYITHTHIYILYTYIDIYLFVYAVCANVSNGAEAFHPGGVWISRVRSWRPTLASGKTGRDGAIISSL